MYKSNVWLTSAPTRLFPLRSERGTGDPYSINEARQQVESFQVDSAEAEFRDRMLRVIAGAQARSL
jgi:hypothetical protein